MTKLHVPCLPIKQPIGTFYIGVIGAADLCEISYADIRRLEKRELDLYLGIQRPLSDSRVSEIKRYVKGIDATFPTGVILAINSERAKFNKQKSILTIDKERDVAKIIDGQHRIAGLGGIAIGEFNINVVIFIDMDIEDQAMVFATINLAQTKVNKSLVYDLFEFTQRRSPQKTAHNIARVLGKDKNSPLRDRIKILGTADPAIKEKQLLTQATVVESIVKLISGSTENAEKDREAIKRRQGIERPSSASAKGLIFRNMFIDGLDAEIAQILFTYFDAVEKKWKTAWNETQKRGNILPRTNGFRALMRFLPDAYNFIGVSGVPTKAEFFRIFSKIAITNNDFNIENYPPGSSGEVALLRDLQFSLDK